MCFVDQTRLEGRLQMISSGQVKLQTQLEDVRARVTAATDQSQEVQEVWSTG